MKRKKKEQANLNIKKSAALLFIIDFQRKKNNSINDYLF